MQGSKIVVVGNYRWNFYEHALVDGFQSIGLSVSKYEIESIDIKSQILSHARIKAINNNFISEMTKETPDIIFLYRINEININTLRKLHLTNQNIFIIGFHNDNPYRGIKNNIKYWNFHNCLSEMDLVYVYRESNIHDALKRGAKNVKLLMPYYYSKLHLNNNIDFNSKIYDVVYVGHVENDGRIETLDYLIRHNIKLHLFGPGWEKVGMMKGWPLEIIHKPVYGQDYFNIISKAKISLCFFSKANDDVYTRRVFEIPAMGSILATQNSNYIRKTFINQKDAVVFNSNIELLKEVVNILSNTEKIRYITLEGQNKIINNGNSEVSRAIQISEDYLNLFSA